jgi:hypothetical protein
MSDKPPVVYERRAGQGIPAQFAFSILLAIIAGISAYFGGQLSTQKNISNLQANIASLEQHNAEVTDPAIASLSMQNPLVKDALCTLLRDRGYASVKLCTIGEISTGPTLKSN